MMRTFVSRLRRWERSLELTCVVIIGGALALAYGSPYGWNNQTTYLLEPLVRAFPELYHRDWLVAETHHYHVAFGYVTAPLYWLDFDGVIAFGIAQLVTMICTFAAIYGLIAAVTTRARVAIFAGIAGLLSLGGGRALGGTYLYAGYLQPSSLASLAWLVAMVAWIRGSRLIAGVALAVGGVFHLNFAVLGIGCFGLAEVCSRSASAKKLLQLVVPSFVVMMLFVPMLVGSSEGDTKLGLHVLVKFALNIHFWPKRVRFEVWALTGWLALAWAMRPTVDGMLMRLRWFAICSLGCCLVAVWLFSIPQLLPLTRLFVWRIAPFGQLAAQILLVVGVCAIARGERHRPMGWYLIASILGAAAVVYNAYARPREPYPIVIAVAMVGCVGALVFRRELIVRALCVVACVIALWTARANLVSTPLFRTADSDVTRWARTMTPKDALFLAPPYAYDFRLLSRRAIVVDTKSPPMYLNELVAWYRRLCMMVDATTLDRIGDAWARWDALPPDRLLAIARNFHADYIVLWKGRSKASLHAPLAYEDDFTLVYSVGP